MKAEKLPSGRYRVRVSAGKDENENYHYKSFTADTKKEAIKMAAEFIARKNNENQAPITFLDACKAYNEARKGVLRPGTVLMNECRTNIFAESNIAEIPIDKISTEDVQIWAGQYSSSRKRSTTEAAITYINSVLAFHGCKKIKVTLPRKQKKQYHAVTDEELKLLLDNSDEEMKLAILIASFMPARKGEVLALNGEDINRKDCTITINKTIAINANREWVPGPPKTEESYRTVKMPKAIIDLIPNKEGKIFDISYPSFTEKFATLRKRVGLSFRFHDLRGYGASVLHARGVPDKYIMQRGGWASVETLQRVYEHCLPKTEELAYQETEKQLSEVMKIVS